MNNGLDIQNKIFDKIRIKENKYKKILLFLVFIIPFFATIVSLSFSYKAYKDIEDVLIQKDNVINKEYYQTLVVSYDSGKTVSFNNNVSFTIYNDGDSDLYYNVIFSNIDGDSSNFIYNIKAYDVDEMKNALSSEGLVLSKQILKVKESKKIEVSLNKKNNEILDNNYKFDVIVEQVVE